MTHRLTEAQQRRELTRTSWLFALVMGILLSGCATARTTAIDPVIDPLTSGEPRGDLFERYHVDTGEADHQTILTGFLLSGEVADLVSLHVDDSGDVRLNLYSYVDGGWAPSLDASLGSDVMFVDVVRIGERDRLILYQRARLKWFDPDSMTQRVLAEVPTTYNASPSALSYAGNQGEGPTDEGEVPHVDITRDLNHDGRDDLILPDVDGFWVLVQRNGSVDSFDIGSAFADPVKLGPAEPFRDEVAFGDERTYGEVGVSPLTIPWYLSRVHEADYDQDGRIDLVFWNQDHFDVHRQDGEGLFSPVAEPFAVDVPFDSDGAYSLMFGLSGEGAFRLVFGLRKSSRRTLLRSVRDVNGDGVADLIVQSLDGRSILRQRSLYDVHLGNATPGSTLFALEPTTVIQPKGKAAGIELGGYSSLWLEDFDGDDQLDLLRGDLKLGVASMVRALLGTSITMRFELYCMEDGAYPDKASTKGRFKADIAFRGGRDAGFFPSVLVGDVNGDGRSDVLAGKNREELHVFLGGPELSARQARRVAVTLPGDERNSWLVDVNQDGKQDLLLHHPSTTDAHRVTLLVAR